MKIGDLVVCNCASDVWYRGLVGMFVGYDHFGHYSTTAGDPLVMYSQETVRLAGVALEIVHESW